MIKDTLMKTAERFCELEEQISSMELERKQLTKKLHLLQAYVLLMDFSDSQNRLGLLSGHAKDPVYRALRREKNAMFMQGYHMPDTLVGSLRWEEVEGYMAQIENRRMEKATYERVMRESCVAGYLDDMLRV